MAAITSEELQATFNVTKIEPRPAGGTWVTGTIAGYEFQALAFPDHAAQPEFELGTSRLSKLWIGKDGRTLFSFDRGFDVTTRRAELREIIEFLVRRLAADVFDGSNNLGA